MTSYRVRVTAQLADPIAVDLRRVRAVLGARASWVAPDIVHVTLTRRGRDAECAADRVLIDLNRALAPAGRFAREPVWTARPLSLRGLLRVATGRWHIDGGGDDGLAGVREPRRPLPPHGSAAVALDPPAA